MQKHSFLKYLSTYVKLTPDEESHLLSMIKHRKYLKGHFILQNGDTDKNLNFTISGATKTFYVDDKGKEHVVMIGIENWWVGDLSSFISQTPADYNVQCIEPTEMMQLSFQQYEQLLDEIPKIERFFRILIGNAYIATQKRIIMNYTLSAKERYIQFCEKYPDISNRIPLYLIASYLGITKEFLSKIRNQMAK